MADAARRRRQNVPGPFFVDDTCIDCGTCMWMAPSVFEEQAGMSAVVRQPDADTLADASAAVIACPTGSIGGELVSVTFPRPHDEGVWHLGFHDRNTFGAASWLVQADGLCMVDVPRYNEGLARRIEEIGAVKRILLTHRDDVGDHDRWADRLGATRVLHEDDVDHDTQTVETKLQGQEPVRLGDVEAIPVPGHTKGHTVYRVGDVLFTGDHLAWDGRLVAFRRACWYDWETQIASMRRLLDVPIAAICPGHGAPVRLTRDAMREDLVRLVAWMQEHT